MAVESTVQAAANAEMKEKRYTLRDILTTSFGLRVDVDGSRTCLFDQAFEGRQRWHTIGRETARPATVQA